MSEVDDVKMEFNSTLGAAFLGHLATAILYGITSLQAFYYYKQHHGDPRILKVLVFILWILDGTHLALITYAMYFYMVLNFADPAMVEKPVWSVMIMIMVSNISNIIVRAIFSHRLWRLSGKALILPLSIGIISLYVTGDAFYFATRGIRSSSYQDLHNFSWSLYLGFSFEVIVDGMITISQCLLLRRFRTGIRRTDSVITVLMLYSINTGLFTSVCALLCLITFTVLPNMFVYFAFYFVLSKLYVNSLLANLNARSTIRKAIIPFPGDRPFDQFDSSEKSTRALTHVVSATTAPQFSSVIDNLVSPSAMSDDARNMA